MRGNFCARLERLSERVGPPEEPGKAKERAERALETIHVLILEHADEIDRDHGERIERGEEHLPALVAAKREALAKTEEGRRAWAVAEVLEGRGAPDGA